MFHVEHWESPARRTFSSLSSPVSPVVQAQIALRADRGRCYKTWSGSAHRRPSRRCAMRVIALSLVGLLALTVSASAQQQETIGTVLRGWEKAMTDLNSFVAKVGRSTLDKALNARDEFKGYAMFQKPANKNDSARA